MLKEYIRAASNSGQAAEEFVAAYWDEKWREHRKPRQWAIRRRDEYRFIRKILPDLATRALDILDCGCGPGEWTLLFRSDGHRATGIDIADKTIQFLRNRHGDIFRIGDFRKIDCPDNSYDLVINWGGIEHFEEGPMPAIREALRVLRPGGLFAATTPCHNLRLFLRDALLGRGGGPGHPSVHYRFYQYRFSRTELEGYFGACGFTRVRSRIIHGAHGVGRSLDHELRWVGAILPRFVRLGTMWLGGQLLRPFLGHMVICCGTKPSGE